MSSKPTSSGCATPEPMRSCPAIKRACSAREAGSRETSATPTCGDSGRARSSTASPSEIQTKPSEPSGCGSRRCRRRTELVERVVAAVNERDVEGYVGCCADDVKLQTPWSAVEGVYEGSEAIRRFFADLQDTAPNFRLTIERAEPIGDSACWSFCALPSPGE